MAKWKGKEVSSKQLFDLKRNKERTEFNWVKQQARLHPGSYATLSVGGEEIGYIKSFKDVQIKY